MSFGLTPEGLVIKTLPQIRAEREQRYRDRFGASLPLGDQTLEGQTIAIDSEREAVVWELLEVLFGGFDRDKVSGAGLRALCLLTGTFPPPPRPSEVTAVLAGDDGTTIDAGSQAAVPPIGDAPPTAVFETVQDETLALADDWVTATPYEIGDVVTVGAGTGHVILATESGISGASTPSGLNDFNDDNIQWAVVGDGKAFAIATMRSTVEDAIEAAALQLSQIVTPVSGWTGVLNAEDALLGNGEMKDADLRILAEVELNRAGISTLRGIRAALIEVGGVINVSVFENNTDATVDGMPPHSVEALVQGGAAADIAQTLFESVAAGIVTTGGETETVTDDEGIDHDIKFSRPEEVPIYVDITLTKDPDVYPDDGDDLVKAAIVAYGIDHARNYPGRNAVASVLSAAILAAVPGIFDVEPPLIDDAPAPATSTTVVIDPRQLATYDAANIAVTSSDGDP